MSKVKCDSTYKTRIKGSSSRLLYLTDKDNYKFEKSKTDTISFKHCGSNRWAEVKALLMLLISPLIKSSYFCED